MQGDGRQRYFVCGFQRLGSRSLTWWFFIEGKRLNTSVRYLEVDVKSKLGTILTPEQFQQLDRMRPPQRQGDQGASGPQPGATDPVGAGAWHRFGSRAPLAYLHYGSDLRVAETPSPPP